MMEKSFFNRKTHIVTPLTEELAHMNDLVMKMGGLVEKRSRQAIDAISSCNVKTAKKIASSDYKVNNLELEIDAECTRILALHQPVARDLRLVSGVLKMITDLERVGDEAQRIAKTVTVIEGSGVPEDLLNEVSLLGERVIHILHISLDSFARMEDQTRYLQKTDREIDDMCDNSTARVLAEMEATPQNIPVFLSIIWCIRSLERIGDHARNIGEYTVYMLKGKDIRHASANSQELG